MSRVELQPAFILHQRRYRDTSLILDVFTLHHGRIGLVARGARGGKRYTARQLQPFRQLLLSWVGKGELFNMTDVEEVGCNAPHMLLKGESLFCGYYINELTMKLLPRDDPHEDVFAVYNQTLNYLCADAGGSEPALRNYELTLLESLGYQLALQREVTSGDALKVDGMYCYIPGCGPVYDEGRAGPGVRVSGSTLLALQRRDFSISVTWAESRRLLRMLIDQQLDGRPLKSRELFHSLFRDQSYARDSQ